MRNNNTNKAAALKYIGVTMIVLGVVLTALGGIFRSGVIALLAGACLGIGPFLGAIEKPGEERQSTAAPSPVPASAKCKIGKYTALNIAGFLFAALVYFPLSVIFGMTKYHK